MTTLEPTMNPKPAYKRVHAQAPGEALMGEDAYGINRATAGAHRRPRWPKSCAWASRWAS